MTWRAAILNLAVAVALPLDALGGVANELPFELKDGLLWVQARTSSDHDLSFLVDTGAGVSVLNLLTVQRLKLGLGRRVAVQGVGTSTTGYWPETLAARAGDVRLPERYLAVDLTALSGACHSSIDGLLGADFFQSHVVELDFEARKLRLRDPSWVPLGEMVPLRIRRGALEVSASVNEGPNGWFRLDTGCATALQWVRGRPGRYRPTSLGIAGIRSSKSEATPNPQASESRAGSTQAVGLAPVKTLTASVKLQLGSFRFEDVPAGVHEHALFPGEAGLLGAGLLSRFSSVTLDAGHGRLWLRQ